MPDKFVISSSGELRISGGNEDAAGLVLGSGGAVGERGGDIVSSARRFTVAIEPRLVFVFSVKPVTHGDFGGPGLSGEDGSSLPVAGRMGGFGKLMRPIAEYTSELLPPLNGLSKEPAGTGGAWMDTPSSFPTVLVPTAALVDMVDMTGDRGMEES